MKSSYYSDALILIKGTMLVWNTKTAYTDSNNANAKVILKKCAPFKSWITETNNIQVHNSQDVDVVMPMYSLLEYSGNYSDTSESLFQYYRDEPAFNNDGIFVGFEDNNANDSFKFKQNKKKQVIQARMTQKKLQ